MTTDPSAGVARLVRRALPDPADVPDGRLLDRYARHADQEAFAVLVRRHGPMVLGVGRRVLGNAADADDAFQAAFLVLARKAGELSARPTVGNFLYGVTVHTALKAKAMAATRRRHELASGGVHPRRLPDPDLREVLDAELAALPDKYREPLVLHELEGLPRKTVAARLGIPDGTLSSRLATAKRLLADRLTRAGLPAAVAATALDGVGRAAVPPGLVSAAVAAAGGGAAAGVLQLAREVSVMLLVRKLKLGAAAGVVAAAVGVIALAAAPRTAADPPMPAEPPKPTSGPVNDPAYRKMLRQEEDAVAALRGTWELESISVNGSLKNKGPARVWTFTDNRVLFTGDVKRWYTVNPRAIPAELTIYHDGFLMLCRYKIEDNRLTIAYFERRDVERPADFTRAEHTAAQPLHVDTYRRVKGANTPVAVLDRFQGTWDVVSLTQDGTDVTKEAKTVRGSMVVDGDQCQLPPGSSLWTTIRPDPAQYPRTVDFVLPRSPQGPVVIRGIYEFDGDALTLCLAKPGEPRPTTFAAPVGSKHTLAEFKRAKK